jgi:hypothetical protein
MRPGNSLTTILPANMVVAASAMCDLKLYNEHPSSLFLTACQVQHVDGQQGSLRHTANPAKGARGGGVPKEQQKTLCASMAIWATKPDLTCAAYASLYAFINIPHIYVFFTPQNSQVLLCKYLCPSAALQGCLLPHWCICYYWVRKVHEPQ